MVKIPTTEDFAPGSILLVSYSNKYLARGFVMGRYTHPAIVCLYNKSLCVFELCLYDNEEGLKMLPLDQWLYRNKKHTIMLNKLLEFNNVNDIAISFYEKFKNVKIKSSFMNYLNPFVKYKGIEDNEERWCSEVVGDILIRAGEIEEKPLEHIHPESFNKMKIGRSKYDTFVLDLEKFSYYVRRGKMKNVNILSEKKNSLSE